MAVLLLGGCAADLPLSAPPLRDMEEPLVLFDEPPDETARRDLPAGGFTGVYVVDARRTLDALVGEPEGLEVERVVENSPGDAAGLERGDLLVEAAVDRADTVELRWPSQWRALELETPPGTDIQVTYDRAGALAEARVQVEPRLRPADRHAVERYREEARAGVVLRTATEVEARAAGLGPGAGAVIVGLSRASPWRRAGLRFGDLVAAVDGAAVDHPQVVLERVGAAGERDTLELRVVRDGEPITVEAGTSRRADEITRAGIPLLLEYERDRGMNRLSILLGLFEQRTTAAAWDLRLLWLIHLGGGDADRLEEIDP